MQLYEQRANEIMKPLGLKRPIAESPDKMLKRQASDISIPPSFRLHDETQKQSSCENRKGPKSKQQAAFQGLQRSLQKCAEIEVDEDQEDTVYQDHGTPERAIGTILNADDEEMNVMSLSLFDQIRREERFDTARAMEGPLRPRSSQHRIAETVQSQRLDIRSPHFNEDAQ